MMSAIDPASQETRQQVLQLLWKHNCLKFSTMRELLQADRLQLHNLIKDMESDGLVRYTLDEHYKFSGYSLTTKGLTEKQMNEGLDAFDTRDK